MTSIGPFISVLTDFGFKHIIANTTDTSFLRKTIQIMIRSEVPIREVRITNTHKTANVPGDRGAVYDVSCIDENERRFIVEMQRSKLDKFIHRAKFYAYFLYNEMVEKGGEMKYHKLRPIYTISFLDGKAYPTKELHHSICLRNQHGELIDDQITHVMLELGKWNKAEHDIRTDLDKLILLMKFTDTATAQDPIPEVLTKEEWTKNALEQLKTNNLTSEERMTYIMALGKQASYDEIDRTYELGMKKVETTLQELAEAQQKLEEETQKAAQKIKEAEQKVEQAEQKVEQAEQKVEQAEQKVEQAEQKAEQAEQKAKQSAIKKLLQKGTLTDEDIAGIFDVDTAYVQAIKGSLES